MSEIWYNFFIIVCFLIAPCFEKVKIEYSSVVQPSNYFLEFVKKIQTQPTHLYDIVERGYLVKPSISIIDDEEDKNVTPYNGRLDIDLLLQANRYFGENRSARLYSSEELRKIDGNLPKIFILFPKSNEGSTKNPKDPQGALTRRANTILEESLPRLMGFLSKELDRVMVIPVEQDLNILKALRSRISFGIPDVSGMEEELSQSHNAGKRNYLEIRMGQQASLSWMIENFKELPPFILVAGVLPKSSFVPYFNEICNFEAFFINEESSTDLTSEEVVKISRTVIDNRYLRSFNAWDLHAVKEKNLTCFFLVYRRQVHSDLVEVKEFEETLSTLGVTELGDNWNKNDPIKRFEPGVMFGAIDVTGKARINLIISRVKELAGEMIKNKSSDLFPLFLAFRYDTVSRKFITTFQKVERVGLVSLPMMVDKMKTKIKMGMGVCRRQVALIEELIVKGSVVLPRESTNSVIGLSSVDFPHTQISNSVIVAYYAFGDSISSLKLRSLIGRLVPEVLTRELNCIPFRKEANDQVNKDGDIRMEPNLGNNLVVVVERNSFDHVDTLTLYYEGINGDLEKKLEGFLKEKKQGMRRE